MIIKVKDEQGLGNALMMDGYTDRQICGVYDAVRAELKKVAELVFQEIKEEALPDVIVAHTAHDVLDDEEGRAVTLASFDSELSHEGELVFNIHEMTIKRFLTGDETEIREFRSTMVHEMMHAADLPMLLRRNEILYSIERKIDETSCHDALGRHKEYPQIALFNLLKMLGHYRAEGIAILGELLVKKEAFVPDEKAVRLFRSAFEWTLFNSSQWVSGVKAIDKASERSVWSMAYSSAPVVLSKVLFRRGDIDEPVFRKVMNGLNTGVYLLADPEWKKVLRAALSLSFQEFVLGLMQLGDDVAPLTPLLGFFARFQNDFSASGIESFVTLIQSPAMTETFDATVESVMGSVIPEDELDEFFADFMQNPPDAEAYPSLKEKVEALYALMKNAPDLEKRRIAQWALTYFFDDQDLIHDDIPGMGLLDDIVILEQALAVL